MIQLKIEDSTTNGIPVLLKTERGYLGHIYVGSDHTNCKLSYIHGAGCLSGRTQEEIKEVIKKILGITKGCVILNTKYKDVFTAITSLYPVYYASEVPIGYNNGFQYHVCFKNTVKINGSCREPKKLESLDKTIIKQRLMETLKIRRRKTDYVDEFINSL